MPWAAIPFGDAGRRRALAARCGVRGIPTLATIGSDGVVINQKAKESAVADAKVWNGNYQFSRVLRMGWWDLP